jgi:hypothetical protein
LTLIPVPDRHLVTRGEPLYVEESVMAKSKPRKVWRSSAKFLLGVKVVLRGGEVNDAEDDGLRLFLQTLAEVVEGDHVRSAEVAILMRDEEAQRAIFYLLANMKPRLRNQTVRTITRGGFGPLVDRIAPSKG